MLNAERGTRSTENKQRPLARVKYQGFQQGFGAMPGFELYNIISGHGLTVGSTITLNSLRKAGYAWEIVR